MDEEIAADYYIVGLRPVKYVYLASGGADVQAFDWATGRFGREMGYLTRLFAGDPEVDAVDASTFAQAVIARRQDLAAKGLPPPSP